MADKKKLSFSINDAKSFFADEVSITNGPTRIILDFKVTTPRIDVRAKQGPVPLVTEHNVVQLDAHLAKRAYKLLGEHLEKYEEKFGEIKEPHALTQAREEHEADVTTAEEKPGYFG